MFRNMLVHVPTERAVRPVIDVAIGLALARRSHFDAVATGYESIIELAACDPEGGQPTRRPPDDPATEHQEAKGGCWLPGLDSNQRPFD
jgi:hypothetical protein